MGKAEIGGEAAADIVAVEHVNLEPEIEQPVLGLDGDGRFARRAEAGEPEDGAAVSGARRPRLGGDAVLDDEPPARPIHQHRPLIGKPFDAGDAADDGEFVDQHEPAGSGIDPVGIERKHGLGAQNDLGEAIALDRFGLVHGKILGVDDMFDGAHIGRGLGRVRFQQQLLPHPQRFLPQPEQPGPELVGLGRQVGFVADDISALDEELLLYGEPDRGTGFGLGDGLGRVPGLDRAYRPGLIRWRKDDRVADAYPAAFDPPGDNAGAVEFVDVLHRKTQRQIDGPFRPRQPVHGLGQDRSPVPSHALASRSDVIARSCHHGDEAHRRNADLLQVIAEQGFDFAEAPLIEIHLVHLVDGDDDLIHAQEVKEIGVFAGLLAHALGGVDHHHGGVAAGGAGDHVLEEFVMSRGVDQDVIAAIGAINDMTRIDGEGLVPLRRQRVGDERPFERHAAALAHRFHRLDLANRKRSGVVEEAADDGRLAMVDVTDKGDAQGLAGGRRAGGFGHSRPLSTDSRRRAASPARLRPRDPWPGPSARPPAYSRARRRSHRPSWPRFRPER